MIRTIAALVFLLGCTKATYRGPASLQGIIEVPNDLERVSQEILGFFGSPSFTPESCSRILNDLYEGVFNKEATYFDRSAIGAGAFPILENLWQAKQKLRERIGPWIRDGAMKPECMKSVRDVLRAMRFIEDFVGAWRMNPTGSSEKVFKAFTGGFPYLMLAGGKERLELQAGDVLMSRGNAFTSAAIARIGDDDAQFSHLAIVHVDPATGKKYVVEAHIEIGLLEVELEKYQSDGKVRSVVYRHPDAKLAALAGRKIYDHAKDLRGKATSYKRKGENVPYDFRMDSTDRRELFCSEVVEYAFELAAQELGVEFRMPLYRTTFSMRNRDFLERIGVEGKEAFAPADIEVDPRFQLVAEWRDYDRVRQTHYKDAILTSMFLLMERDDYTMHGNPITWLKSTALWHARRWPLFEGLLEERFPRNMMKKTIGTMLLLDNVGESLLEELEKREKERIRKTGLGMTMKEMVEVLDEFRKKELEDFQRPRRQDGESPEPNHMGFHNHFRPRNL
ncbi:MAG: hypothetical protein HUU37_06045 [Bdellovibrionales bacterium]|nr:hypothetical protein [Bdellovibrionales bacterium]